MIAEEDRYRSSLVGKRLALKPFKKAFPEHRSLRVVDQSHYLNLRANLSETVWNSLTFMWNIKFTLRIA